ncbi:hypothetical protein [Methylomonas sp. CM2]|uniref:hypothetical protein n=1 Tax=Methylomonas sp. CM2 TaxID=3417647 RepID=UPI003CF4C507
MTFSSFKPLLAFGLLALSMGPQTAGATVVATATVHWNPLDVEIIDLSGGFDTPQFSWVSPFGSANTYAYTDHVEGSSDNQSVDDFTTQLSSVSNSRFSGSHAERGDGIVQVQAQGDVLGNNYAVTEADSQGSFEMRGKGVALITLDWTLEVSGVEYVNKLSATGFATVSLSGNDTDQNGTNGYSTMYALLNPSLGSESKSGRFRFAVTGDGVNVVSGNFVVTAYVNTSVNDGTLTFVPIPSAFWLFGGTVVAALGGLKRKSLPTSC